MESIETINGQNFRKTISLGLSEVAILLTADKVGCARANAEGNVLSRQSAFQIVADRLVSVKGTKDKKKLLRSNVVNKSWFL